MHIHGVTNTGLKRIVEERASHGPYRNLVDFIGRVPVGSKDIEHLILTGAFDGFGLTQPESLFLLDDIYKKVRPDEPGLVRREHAACARFSASGPERLYPGAALLQRTAAFRVHAVGQYS